VVLDHRVGAGEDEPHVAVIRPAYEVRRAPVRAMDLQDLGILVRRSDTVAPDHQPIPHAPVHARNPLTGDAH